MSSCLMGAVRWHKCSTRMKFISLNSAKQGTLVGLHPAPARNYRVEPIVHVLFWLFIFSAVNVDWSESWLDRALRPRTPAPLSVLVFPIFFYAHALWALPAFFKKRDWLRYGLSLLLIFGAPELLRVLTYAYLTDYPWRSEFSSGDSFILGRLDIAWRAFVFSSGYWFIKDWFVLQRGKSSNSPSASEAKPLAEEEARQLSNELERLMSSERIFLSEKLTLSDLAEALSTTDKKLSTLLNQHLGTNFSDYVNGYRVAHFLAQVEEGQLERLSIMGLAEQCGFSSKATFYRAFKKAKQTTPSSFLRSRGAM